jgi:hypothetical protein
MIYVINIIKIYNFYFKKIHKENIWKLPKEKYGIPQEKKSYFPFCWRITAYV